MALSAKRTDNDTPAWHVRSLLSVSVPLRAECHLRSCRSDGNRTHPADAILLEMLRLRHRNGTDTLLATCCFSPSFRSSLYARQLAPLSTASGRRHRAASGAALLETSTLENSGAASPGVCHFAHGQRTTFEWAERERASRQCERDEPVVPIDDVVWGIPAPLERAVLLRPFSTAASGKAWSAARTWNLVHIKLAGNFLSPTERLPLLERPAATHQAPARKTSQSGAKLSTNEPHDELT